MLSSLADHFKEVSHFLVIELYQGKPSFGLHLSNEEVGNEWKLIYGTLMELAEYGQAHYDEKVLRDMPEVRFLTNRIEDKSNS